MMHRFRPVRRIYLAVVIVFLLFSVIRTCARAASSQDFQRNPHDIQVVECIEKLKSPSQNMRAAAAESLGFLRAYRAAEALGLYGDPAAVQPLTRAYPRFAKKLSRELADVYPRDDLAKLGWDPQDRMYETPYAIYSKTIAMFSMFVMPRPWPWMSWARLGRWLR